MVADDRNESEYLNRCDQWHPSAAATYNFTIKVTDANGSTGTQAFEIIVSVPVFGGGSFTYAA